LFADSAGDEAPPSTDAASSMLEEQKRGRSEFYARRSTRVVLRDFAPARSALRRGMRWASAAMQRARAQEQMP
jgi:hypothetical protein